MAVGQRRITLEEFLAMPEQKPELELMDGEVTPKMAPVTEHVVLQLQFRDLVDDFARPRKLARAFPELRESYAEASTIPDVSVYTWDRLPRSPSGGWNNDVRNPPDLAFEVRSPSQSATDVLVRCLWYVANGARVSIYADPTERLVVVFRPLAEPIVLVHAGTVDLSDVIRGFALDIAELFAALIAD
ncbi:MAG TPA: Uma2 family endonuclease [Chloroflexota bacterium]|nr:Uma2 family endonuclease [Chloroflexota bacterium]